MEVGEFMIKRIFAMILVMFFLTSCSAKNAVIENKAPITGTTSNSAQLQHTNFENIELPSGYNIRQFEGMTLNFIVEKNQYANILSHESEEFSKVTGINVKIRALDFDTLVQKINLDFIAQAGKYQLVYVDPYQTLNRFYNYLEVLNPYNEDMKIHLKLKDLQKISLKIKLPYPLIFLIIKIYTQCPLIVQL